MSVRSPAKTISDGGASGLSGSGGSVGRVAPVAALGREQALGADDVLLELGGAGVAGLVGVEREQDLVVAGQLRDVGVGDVARAGAHDGDVGLGVAVREARGVGLRLGHDHDVAVAEGRALDDLHVRELGVAPVPALVRDHVAELDAADP
jgi:hypothetical protein